MTQAHEILVQLSGMLAPDSPNPGGCDCPACQHERREAADSFTCNLCGYTGAPASSPCACPEKHPHPSHANCGTGVQPHKNQRRRHGGNWELSPCAHGMLYCPVCKGEYRLAFDLLCRVRAVLSSAEEETLKSLGIGRPVWKES